MQDNSSHQSTLSNCHRRARSVFYRVHPGSGSPETSPGGSSSRNAFTRRKFVEIQQWLTFLLSARSLPNRRKILVDAPYSFVNKHACLYELVLDIPSFSGAHWFAGARLLLGAGVLTLRSGVKHLPPGCAKQFKPSLEEMCQKVISANLKRPLAQSVEKLPLPGVVKKPSLQIAFSSNNTLVINLCEVEC